MPNNSPLPQVKTTRATPACSAPARASASASALNSIPRIAWIGAVGVSLSMCLLGICAGIGIGFMLKTGVKRDEPTAKNAKTEIVKDGAGKKKDSGEIAKQKSPAFDPEDFDRTKKWATEIAATHQALRINKIALDDSVTKFNDDAQFVGKQIRWSVPVLQISEKEVALKVNAPSFLLTSKDGPNQYALFTLDVDKDISRQRAAKLREDDTIVITGTVRKVYFLPYPPDQAGVLVIVIAKVKAE